jgi:hypothetical protein
VPNEAATQATGIEPAGVVSDMAAYASFNKGGLIFHSRPWDTANLEHLRRLLELRTGLSMGRRLFSTIPVAREQLAALKCAL